MICIREESPLIADMKAGTVFGYNGTFCVKLEQPVAVVTGPERTSIYQAFDLQQSRLISLPIHARGFIIKGNFVEGAVPK